ASRLRTIKPAETSRISDKETYATTSELRNRERRKPAIEASSFKLGTSAGLEDWSAGKRLKAIPVRIDKPSAKNITRQSSFRSNTSEMSIGSLIPPTKLLIHAANSRPSAPPASESKTPSVSN